MNAMDESEITRRTISGLKWTASIRICAQMISWVMSIFVIRYIQPAEYGLKSMAEISMGLLMIVSSGGLESALIHAKELSIEIIRKSFGLLIGINLALIVLQVFVAYPLAEYYHEQRIVMLVQIMSLGFLFVPFTSIPLALLSREMDYKLISSISLVTNIIGAACTLSMAVLGYGVWSLIAGPLLAAFLNAFFLNIAKPCLRLPRFSIKGVSDIALFGGTVVVTSILWTVFSRADIFIAGRTLDTHQIGIYAVAIHLASLPVEKLIPILNQVAFPAYSQLRENPAAVAKYFLKAVRLSSLILFPITFALAGIAPYFIPAVLGKEWSGVTPVFLALSLVCPLKGINALCAPLTNALGKPTIQLHRVILATVMMVPGFIYGVQYGLMGLTLVWICVYPWVVLSNLWVSKKVLGISLASLIRAFLPPLFMAGIMLFGLICFASTERIILNTWITMSLMVMMACAIFISGMFVLSKNRLSELLNLLHH
jgi:teichuronic acid exporter